MLDSVMGDHRQKAEVTDSHCVLIVIKRIEDRLRALRPEDKDKIARGIGTHDTIALKLLEQALEHLDQ